MKEHLNASNLILSWKPRIEILKQAGYKIDGRLLSCAKFIAYVNECREDGKSMSRHYFSRVINNRVNLTRDMIDLIENHLSDMEKRTFKNKK